MRKRQKKGTGIGIIAMVVLILFGIVTFRRVGLAEERADAEIKIARLDTRIQKQKEREIDIENFRKYSKTPQYIEQIAREKLGLVYKDEIIFEEEKQ